jgi:hypothetical protein
MKNLSPIVLFTYNRPWHTRKTLDALSKNTLADASVLYVFADGAKEGATEQDINKIKEVRKIVREKKWCKEVHLIERERNLGLADNIIDGITQIVNQYGKIIVLEDDLLTGTGFLTYMNSALNIYKESEDVISISGYVYPVKKHLPETFFIKGADCWGWATWKRGWTLFERDPKKLYNELINHNLSFEFDYEGNYPYTQMLKEQMNKKYSWAILWYASAFLKNKLTLYPNLSLIKHIGIGGTNHGSDPFLDKVNFTDEINVISTHICENKDARQAFVDFFAARKKYFEKKKRTFLQKIISYLINS